MRLGVAAAPKCTHPLIHSVRNQKLLPTCISVCRRVGDPSVDPVYVQIHRADNGRWTRSLAVKKPVGIPKKNTRFVDGVRRIFRNLFLLSLHLLVIFLLLLSFILLVFFLSVLHPFPLPSPSFPSTL